MRVVAVSLLALLLVGCNVHASSPQQFPTVPTFGGEIVMEPGTYTCPTSIPSGTHIHGHKAIITQEMLADSFAPTANRTTPLPVVRIVCNSDLKLSGVTDLDISGVVFDFQGNGGLVLDSVTYSRLELALSIPPSG